MVSIQFPDREARVRALGFLAGLFSGRVLGTGEVIVPEAALEGPLVAENFSFTVIGWATHEQMVGYQTKTEPKKKE